MSDKYPGGFVTTGAPAGFSVNFSTSSDKLSFGTSTNLALGAGDWTVEAWIYQTSSGAAQLLFDWRTSGGTGANVPIMGISASQFPYMETPGGTNLFTGTVAVVANAWNHVAFCKASGTIRAYVNGVLSGSVANSTTFAIETFNISYSSAPFYGYMSNVRIVKGTALYTAAFTPPTQLFPITNTQLLTCQSPTIIDNSSNAFAVTVSGAVKTSNFTPFAGYTGFNPALGAAAGGVWTLDQAAYYQNNRQWPIYDPYFNQTTLMLHGNGTNGAQNNTFLDSSTNNFTITRNGNTTQGTFTPFSQTGWSTYFLRSNTDYLGLPNGSVATGSNDFSIEAFVYPLDRASNYAVFGGNTDRTTAGGSSITVTLTSTNGYIEFTGWFGGSAVNLYSPTLPINTWTHFVICRTGTTIGMFVNGVRVSTVACSGSINAGSSANNPSIGSNGTGSADNFTGYISNFRMIIGSGVYSALNTSYTVPTSPLTVVTNTKVLACQSNRYVDNSANNYTITPGGSPSVQAFSPFVPAYITPTTYSNRFAATSYLSIASNAAFALPGTFTIEFWIYFSTFEAANRLIAGVPTAGGLTFYTNGTTISPNVYGTGNIFTASNTVVAGQWYHYALSRDASNNMRMWVNGLSVGSTTTATSYAQGAYQINDSAGSMAFVISNLREVKGSTVYDPTQTNITPPTAPLTAITNTQLLTCQSSTFVDNSTNNFTITSSGTVQPVTSPAPFPAKVDTTTLNSAYSTSLIGGSGYFDGSGDYLSIANNTALQLSTSVNWCLEAWIYPTSLTNADIGIIGKRTNSSVEWQFAVKGTGDPNARQIYIYNGTISYYSGTQISGINTWVHVAATWDGTTLRFFINGTLCSTTYTSISLPAASTNSVGIGANGNVELFTGYISGARIVKGSAVYTASFTCPSAPPTAITNTSALLNFTNAGIYDSTAKNVCETVGTAQISTTQSKYGGSSIKTDGSTSSWVYIPFNRNLDLSTGAPDWTLECWGYVVSFANSPYFFNKGGVAATYYTNYSFSMNTSGVVYCTLGNNSGETSYSFGTCATNTWYHFAATRQGSTIRTFLNGVLVTSQSIATTMTDNGEGLYIGCLKNLTSNVLNGYVDDLRITRGYARYTTNFTPPTSQLQDQ